MTVTTDIMVAAGFSVRVDEQGLSGYLVSSAAAAPTKVTTEVLLAYLKAQRIVVDQAGRASVIQAVAAWRSGSGPAEVLVAQGRAAQHGVNGRVVWSTQCDPNRSKTQDDRQFSHYASQFASVAVGEVLCRVEPPTAGQPGVDIYGQTIEARSGAPAGLAIGSGCHLNQADGSVIADISGIVHLRGGTVCVTQALHVTSNVDFATGHIEALGDVEVDGNVSDLFQIRTRGSVAVHGDVQAARVYAEGDLTIGGALANRHKGICLVGGSLRARLMENSIASVMGDIQIGKEAVSCDLFAGGQIGCTAGRICGGIFVARQGVSAKVIGSNGGTRAILIAGVDWMLAQRLAPLDQELEKTNGELEDRAAPLELLKANLRRLTPQQREQVTELDFEFMELQAKRESLNERIRVLRASSEEQLRAEIRVIGTVHPGIQIRLGRAAAEIKRTIPGPVTFRVAEVLGEASIIMSLASGVREAIPTRTMIDALADVALPELPPEVT